MQIITSVLYFFNSTQICYYNKIDVYKFKKSIINKNIINV